MKQLLTTVTKRGQVTVPAEVRRLLGIRPYDKVAFTIDGDEVRLRPVEFTLETAFGSVPPLKRRLSDQEMTRIAWEDKVERTAREVATE